MSQSIVEVEVGKLLDSVNSRIRYVENYCIRGKPKAS